ncbi:hypothetical protein D9757_011422 [Collybiopsis confluens]|uniref:F-box domain-containing protein n=1 Tax=Collybiopsis confluens TaxID=2823264 RepID=A0A8H5GHE7_9AGAR|nr:hypothetical protein D9757_011422 [Collybiopsis confluens]
MPAPESPRPTLNALPSSGIQLPIELWFLIARFIPPHILHNLMSVNRAFFYAVMAERYKEVSFYHLDERITSMLQRLQVSLVRECVRVLRVRPFFIQELLSSRSDTPNVLSSIQTTFSCIPSLIEYHLVWFELPFLDNTPVDILRAPLVGNASRHLRKVFLMASLEKLEALLAQKSASLADDAAAVELPQLEELIISIRRDGGSRAHRNSNDIYPEFTSLSSFLIRHRNSLRRFSLSSSHALDCSSLFRSLCVYQFPQLYELFLSIPTPTPHLGDPSSVTAWLTRQCLPALKSLILKPHFVDDGFTWEESFQDWVKAFVRVQPQQSSLTLSDARVNASAGAGRQCAVKSLRILSGFHTASIFHLVHYFSPSLTSLDLTGRYVAFTDVVNLLHELTYVSASTSSSINTSSRRISDLRSLRLGPVTISPELIDLLAETLPRLQELFLHIQHAVPNQNAQVVYSMNNSAAATTTGPGINRTPSIRKSRRVQSPVQVKEFFEAMSMTRAEPPKYKEWKGMRKVEVWALNGSAKMEWQGKYVQLLEGCIPSLRKREGEAIGCLSYFESTR